MQFSVLFCSVYNAWINIVYWRAEHPHIQASERPQVERKNIFFFSNIYEMSCKIRNKKNIDAGWNSCGSKQTDETEKKKKKSSSHVFSVYWIYYSFGGNLFANLFV